MLKITSGAFGRPQKVVIYGPEGIGKSTLASKFPDPLFTDTEGGTARLNIKRTQVPKTWHELMEIANEISDEYCKTWVLDTADWAEKLCVAEVCSNQDVSGIEDIGYGKGYTYLGEEFQKLLTACDGIISRGVNVVITAHAMMRKFEQPDEMGAYDRWELNLSKRTAPLLKQWSDALLFCNYKTYVVQQNNKMLKAKGQGGKRVIYTTHNPAWDAKNRVGLPDEVDMDYENIRAAVEVEFTRQPSEIELLMKKDNIPEDALRDVVIAKGWDTDHEHGLSTWSARIIDSLIANWAKVVEEIRKGEINYGE